MFDRKKVERHFAAIDRYAKDECYQAADRQLMLLYEEFLRSLGQEREMGFDRLEFYLDVAREISNR